MALTAAIKNKKMLLLKPFSVSGFRCTSSNLRRQGKTTDKAAEEGPPVMEERLWMPHPRTGIYYPRGEERVMDGIPSGAASFDCTFWLRGSTDDDDDGGLIDPHVKPPN